MKVRDRFVSWATLLCFIAGAALGLVRPDWAQKTVFIGKLYISVLKYLALPALILSVFHAALRGGKNAAGILIRALGVFVLLFTVTFLLCSVPYALFAPGKGFSLLSETPWQGKKRPFPFWSICRTPFRPVGRPASIRSIFPLSS